MAERSISNWERRKSALIGKFSLSILLIVVCLLLRFVPPLNTWLSGPPQPVRALTRAMAKITVQQLGGHYPVLVVRDENEACYNIKKLDADSLPDDVYYVWNYSESRHLSCFTAYLVPTAGFRGYETQVVTLDPAHTENFGRELTQAVKVIPFDRALKTHGEEYLGMLDWRTDVHFPLTHVVAGGATYYDPPPSSPKPPGMIAEISFSELRADVARRHNTVNIILWTAMGLLALITTKTLVNLHGLYRKFAEQFPADGSRLAFRGFIQGDLNAMVARYDRLNRERQERLQEEARLNRFRSEMEEKLRYMLETTADEALRARITACLADPQVDLKAMQELWEDLQRQPSSKPPEDRLAVLLESFREYCSEGEWQACHQEAFALLERSGFRRAREYAVEMHEQLRAREKKKQEASETNEEPPIDAFNKNVAEE